MVSFDLFCLMYTFTPFFECFCSSWPFGFREIAQHSLMMFTQTCTNGARSLLHVHLQYSRWFQSGQRPLYVPVKPNNTQSLFWRSHSVMLQEVNRMGFTFSPLLPFSPRGPGSPVKPWGQEVPSFIFLILNTSRKSPCVILTTDASISILYRVLVWSCARSHARFYCTTKPSASWPNVRVPSTQAGC